MGKFRLLRYRSLLSVALALRANMRKNRKKSTPKEKRNSREQAQYSSTDWEAILEDILGDRRMIDTMTRPNNPKAARTRNRCTR